MELKPVRGSRLPCCLHREQSDCLLAPQTDPENTDYSMEHGATRNFQAEKLLEEEEKRVQKEREDEELNNPMKVSLPRGADGPHAPWGSRFSRSVVRGSRQGRLLLPWPTLVPLSSPRGCSGGAWSVTLPLKSSLELGHRGVGVPGREGMGPLGARRGPAHGLRPGGPELCPHLEATEAGPAARVQPVSPLEMTRGLLTTQTRRPWACPARAPSHLRWLPARWPRSTSRTEGRPGLRELRRPWVRSEPLSPLVNRG